jgi:hypothetical protein
MEQYEQEPGRIADSEEAGEGRWFEIAAYHGVGRRRGGEGAAP